MTFFVRAIKPLLIARYAGLLDITERLGRIVHVGEMVGVPEPIRKIISAPILRP
jgi:hypothetical protein